MKDKEAREAIKRLQAQFDKTPDTKIIDCPECKHETLAKVYPVQNWEMRRPTFYICLTCGKKLKKIGDKTVYEEVKDG